MQGSLWYKVGTIPLRFFHFTICFLVLAARLNGIFLFLKQLNASNSLIQIWSKSIQRLLRYCYFMFCATVSVGRWRLSWNAKLQKGKMASSKDVCERKLVRFHWEILCFTFCCFSNGNHLDRSIFYIFWNNSMLELF